MELRDRRAPLAVMESLSDAESLYSLDSRRSSAALRGSPNLGGLTFSLGTPIPEENPSLSSRTELLAADCLGQATTNQDLGELGPYSTPPDAGSTPKFFQRLSPATPRRNSSAPLAQTVLGQPASQGAPIASSCSPSESPVPASSDGSPAPPLRRGAGSGNEEEEEEEGEDEAEGPREREEEKGEARAETEPDSPARPNPLPNGAPSQVVLEFAQYLDSLFKLDGSSPPLELSDGESESGRGSCGLEDGPGEGRPADDQVLLARATLEPNLVPKPPRTFAGSADPSSGISLSPSFPLSSSGELNDLSPADGAPPTLHPLRTNAATCPYPGETTLSSMV